MLNKHTLSGQRQKQTEALRQRRKEKIRQIEALHREIDAIEAELLELVTEDELEEMKIVDTLDLVYEDLNRE